MNPFTKISVILILVGFLSISAAASSSLGSANAWEFCATGDITSKTVMNKMKAYDCKVDVLLGDYYGKESTFVAGFKETGVPLLAACGNHDTCSKVIKYDNIKTGDKTFYGFRWNNVGFLILNTEQSISSQKAASEKVLAKWQNDTAIDLIVLAQHKPAVTNSGAHHKETEAKGYRQQFDLWHQQYPKIKLALSGHNHNFLVCEPTTPNMLFITEGTGGRTPYPIGALGDDNCGQGLSGSKYNGFTIIDVNGNAFTYKHVNAQ